MLRLAFDFIITWRETRTRPNAYDIIPRSSYLFSSDGLTFTFCHLFGKGLFTLFLNIANASGTVRIKQKCKYFAYPIGKQLAFPDIMGAFSTSIKLVFLAT